MIYRFSYNKIIQGIKSMAYCFGIEVVELNPAYTSIIGLANYYKRFGISVH
jgi:transposase